MTGRRDDRPLGEVWFFLGLAGGVAIVLMVIWTVVSIEPKPNPLAGAKIERICRDGTRLWRRPDGVLVVNRWKTETVSQVAREVCD